MLPFIWYILMEEDEEIYNENEDNLAMEVEVISTDVDNVDNSAGVSQNSDILLGVEGTEVQSQGQGNLQGDEGGGSYETVSSRSPQIFQDDLSNHSDNVPTTRDASSPSKRSRLNYDSEEEGSTCPICFDNWTNLGEHRICSLRCGHLFGMSCIKRWLNSETKKQCPTCKKKVNLKTDIRFIFAKKLVAVDTWEVEEIRKNLNVVTEEKNQIQVELTKCLCREHLLVQELEDYKKKVQHLTAKLELQQQYDLSQKKTATQRPSNSLRYYMDKSLELSKDGGCRVLDCRSNLDLIVVSMKSSNNFFVGYGVRKISLSSYKPTGFIGLHMGQIRDIKFHAQNPWLISVSLDKTIKVLDVNSNGSIASLTRNCPLWSCCWDGDNPHSFFIGEQQGTVLKYDMRQITEPIATLFVPGNMSPVVSLAAIKQDPGSAIAHGGIASCKLNSIWIFENTPNEYTRFHFPVEGPFVSMAYQNSTKQMLVSSRPNARMTFARHIVCNISKDREDLRCNTIHSFPGGPTQKMLSRSCFLSNGSDFVAAYHENQRCVCIWNINTGQKACSIPAHDPVLDLCGVQTDSANIFLNLTEKKLEFFKFTD